MDIVTQEYLDITIEVLEIILERTKENEPSAVNTIATIEECLMSMPREVCDI